MSAVSIDYAALVSLTNYTHTFGRGDIFRVLNVDTSLELWLLGLYHFTSNHAATLNKGLHILINLNR